MPNTDNNILFIHTGHLYFLIHRHAEFDERNLLDGNYTVRLKFHVAFDDFVFFPAVTARKNLFPPSRGVDTEASHTH